MASFSNYLETALLNHILRNTAYTSPTSVHVALYTGTYDGTDGQLGNLTEVGVGVGYSRQAVTFNAPLNGVVTNSADITFGPATGSNWGTITAIGIFDESTGGNLLFHGNLANPKAIDVGDSLILRDGSIDVTLD
jgi:hypothetical protein